MMLYIYIYMYVCVCVYICVHGITIPSDVTEDNRC